MTWTHPIESTLCVVLFVLASCDPTVETVEQTIDQNRLSVFAMEAKDFNVRHIAVERLTDQALLAKVALEAEDVSIRHPMYTEDARIRPPSCGRSSPIRPCLQRAKVAVEAAYSKVCRVAVEKLTDQALLAKVAVDAEDVRVRRAAMEKLSDQAVLEEIGITG